MIKLIPNYFCQLAMWPIAMIYLNGCSYSSCMEDGGYLNEYNNCICDAYTKEGACMSLRYKTILVSDVSDELHIQYAEQASKITLNDNQLAVRIKESNQGISLYSDNPEIAIFKPRSQSIDKTVFIENGCRFAFTRDPDPGEKIYKTKFNRTIKIRNHMKFNVRATCGDKLVNTYTTNGSMQVLSLQLNSGQQFNSPTN